MARKTMPAARKRRSPSSEQQQLSTMPAAVLETSASAPSSVDPSGVSSLPSAQHIPSPLDVPSYPSPMSHAHGYKRRARGEIPHLRKWLHACKHLKKVIEEMDKVLPPTAGSPQKGNALSTSYGSTCNLHLKAKKFASIQDLISSLTDLSTWMDNMWPRVKGEYGRSRCLNDTERLGAYEKQNFVQSEVLTSSKDVHMLTLLQLEMIKKAVCQSVSEVVERSNWDTELYGEHPGFSTLMKNASFNSSETISYKRKKSCVGNVSRKATNMVPSIRKGFAFIDQAKYGIECAKNKKFRVRDGFGMDKEKPLYFDVWTTPKMSTGELESWIVKHSMPLKIREHEILSKSKDVETIDKLCLESGKEKHTEIEVDLSQGGGFLLENEAAATDHMPNMVYVKRITETISLNRVNVDGHDEVIVLFKALRSDGKEIIVDNAYLRAAYPLLLATFYEQNLCFLVGKSSSGKRRG